MISLKCGDCLKVMGDIALNSIDLVVTSPPYDNLRTYNGNNDLWNFEVFKLVAQKLFEIVKVGGVVVWVSGDSTKNGSETGTSFKQALYFKEVGFNLYDTMIFQKENYMPLTHRRYEQEFEYMFVFSKGKPKTFNPIKVPCKCAGQKHWSEPTYHKSNDSGLVKVSNRMVKSTKQHGNIFSYRVGVDNKKYKHPAPFPVKLAKDQIVTWSNENDLVLDCFMGSGTTGVACKDTNRRFVGIELDEKYFQMASERILEG